MKSAAEIQMTRKYFSCWQGCFAHSAFFKEEMTLLLALTGALIVIVFYYWSGRQLFQILSIYANIFSLSF